MEIKESNPWGWREDCKPRWWEPTFWGFTGWASFPSHLCLLRQPHRVTEQAAAVQISISDKTLPERYLLMIVNNQMNYR